MRVFKGPDYMLGFPLCGSKHVGDLLLHGLTSTLIDRLGYGRIISFLHMPLSIVRLILITCSRHKMLNG